MIQPAKIGYLPVTPANEAQNSCLEQRQAPNPAHTEAGKAPNWRKRPFPGFILLLPVSSYKFKGKEINQGDLKDRL
ncbi:hypothetical protein AVEN_269501-1 [Araneus ventricosus]|uniref:Uncharacterized protein n=1 Tax=Araneus ventricosus TaxID=182803 RepID=A0A4Y2FQY2_ARAVE|nr:hypothetical protein AVEN_269501-1 [Araneus ventricosus]